MSSVEEVKQLQIALQELSDATNAFSTQNLIAKGGFGKVYKGVSVKHGNIAVKMLDPRLGQGDHEFKTEIALLSVYKHENIVSLLGFCDEDEKKILVYKHESNGSLDKHLNSVDLTWILRLKICLDVARGLQYLHEDVGPQHRILHRDVKSSNILLDENWKAKIADFGLSRVGPANMQFTFLISNVCGTIGYIDPDYYHTGYLTQKSDVYSFGVVLFEVLCERPTRDLHYMDERQFLTNLIKIHWRKQTLEKIIPSDLISQINRASLLTFSSIAYKCLMSVNERPTMKKVVEQLQKALDIQLAPSGPWSNEDIFAANHQGQSARPLASFESDRFWDIDVFISFRGGDTCQTFVDDLDSALIRQQVITFKGSGELPRESEIRSSSYQGVIAGARIAIIIFSPNYASSSWCLKELEYIIEKNDEQKKIIIPIFYGVEPSEVRSCSYYEEALEMHTFYNNIKRVESWRKAILTAANLSGWDVSNGNESEHIKKVVSRIIIEFLGLMHQSDTSAETSFSTDLIGIEARMQELKLLLQVGTGGVRKVGIGGMWGSGKSTLASCIYDEISHEFEGYCFVKNVRDRSRAHGLKMLQEEILSNVLKLKVTLTNLEQGIHMMERSLRQNSILIVLDEVDHADHLEMLVGSDYWFGNGSRIIFTTRNQDLVNGRSSLAYNMRMLDVEEAIELFSRHAFGKSKPGQGFEEVTRRMVSKFGGNPSALIRVGSALHGHDMIDWMGVQDNLQDRPVNEILKEFKPPDDGLARKVVPRFFSLWRWT